MIRIDSHCQKTNGNENKRDDELVRPALTAIQVVDEDKMMEMEMGMEMVIQTETVLYN